MRRVISLLVTIVLLICISACGKTNTAKVNEALELLTQAYELCDSEISYMLKAWNYSNVYSSANTGEEYEALWSIFQNTMGLTEDEVVAGLINGCGYTLQDLSKYGSDHKTKDVNAGLNTVIDGMMLTDVAISIRVARYAYEEKNPDTDEQISQNIETVKTYLQNGKSKTDEYGILKEYYLMVNSMKEWIESPTGSYNSTENMLKENMEKAQQYKAELDLIS